MLEVGSGPGVGVELAAVAVGVGGYVVGVDPSFTMCEMARARCAAGIEAGVVEVRRGTAEDTGCADASMDAAISVNNVMFWDRPVALAELHRVLRPGSRLVVTAHRHVLGVPPERLRDDVTAAGFVDPTPSQHDRRFNSPAVQLVASRA